jgi:hypothetical protein
MDSLVPKVGVKPQSFKGGREGQFSDEKGLRRARVRARMLSFGRRAMWEGLDPLCPFSGLADIRNLLRSCAHGRSAVSCLVKVSIMSVMED